MRGPTAVYGFTINARGRVSEAQLLGQPVAQYGYNALEQRVLKTIPGTPPTVTAYHYGPGGLLLAESDGGGSPIREYVWLGDLLVAQIEAAGPALYFAHADHLGTPDKLTDATKAIVWDAALTPWGEVETQSGTVQVNIRLPGQYHDQETGLSYNWHRDYDPSTGRYMQSDPIGLEGGINRYAYVGANPVSLADPSGLVPFGILVAAATTTPTLPSCSKEDPTGVQSANYFNPYDIGKGPCNLAGSRGIPCGVGRGGGGRALNKDTKIDRGAFKKERESYWKKEAESNPEKYSKDDLDRMRNGRAPTGPDGKPMELHHRDGTPNGPLDPMSRQDHRGGENYKKNHPWLGD